MARRVAVLLIGNLTEALRQRSIEAAESEPYWLHSGQYKERDGGIEFFPAKAPDLMAYCRERNFRPLGVVALAEDGRHYAEYIQCDSINPSPILHADEAFLTQLFQVHAHFWFEVLPYLQSQSSNN